MRNRFLAILLALLMLMTVLPFAMTEELPDDPLPLEAALEEDESFIADEIEDVVDAESQGEDDPSITVMDSENIVAETVELEP